MGIASAIIDNEWLTLLVLAALIFSWIGVSYVRRGRAMRTLAARWGYQYVGPSTPKLVLGYMRKIKPHLPFSRAWYPANEIRQVWNVIEGEEGGVRLVIFDSYIWTLGSRGAYVTFIACETEKNPFGIEIDPDSMERYHVRQSHGWIVLYAIDALSVWAMNIQELEQQLTNYACKKQQANP
jgi:hypothetical protein